MCAKCCKIVQKPPGELCNKALNGPLAEEEVAGAHHLSYSTDINICI